MSSKIINCLVIIIVGVVFFLLITKLIQLSENSEENFIEFVLTAKVIEDDVFQFFYWRKGEQNFKIENSIRSKVKGNEAFQEIRFKLPPFKNLVKVRLDIGENVNQKNVVIKSAKFKFGARIHELSIKSFNRKFSPNKYIQLRDVGNYVGVPGDKDGNSFYDPYFVSNGDSFNLKGLSKRQYINLPNFLVLSFSIVLMLILYKNQYKMNITSELVFVLFFFLMLIVPMSQRELSVFNELDSLEKRKLAEKPVFTFTKSFAQKFETYLDDNFGFRNQLVHWGANLKTKLFKSSIYPNKVMLGKSKWLYYNHIRNTIYKSYKNENLFTDILLKEIVDQWEKNRVELENKGKSYFVAFWPNKHSIYPEFLPNSMAAQIKDTLSRVNQIKYYLNHQNSNVRFIDVRPALLKGKKENQLYHKFDTHWNDYGAFLGYQSFFSQLIDETKISPYQLEDFVVEWSPYSGGDLIPMLGIRNNGFFEEEQPKFILKENGDQIKYLSIEGYPKMTTITRNNNVKNQLKVLVFRDSYTTRLIQFFSLHFYEVTYIWGRKEGFIEKVNPDIVIDCFVERDIGEKHTLNKL